MFLSPWFNICRILASYPDPCELQGNSIVACVQTDRVVFLDTMWNQQYPKIPCVPTGQPNVCLICLILFQNNFQVFRKVGGALEDRVIKWFDYLWQNKVDPAACIHLHYTLAHTRNPTTRIPNSSSSSLTKKYVWRYLRARKRDLKKY